jgi:subtilisin-like proprotein convertase family protein
MEKQIKLKMMHRTLGLLCLLLLCGFGVQAQTSQTYNSSGTYVVPAGVTTVQVEAWGGGGAGGGTNSGSNRGGGGGAGGSFTRNTSVSVTPGASITVTVGTGGVGVTGAAGPSGGTSTFGSSIPVSAVGGAGGNLANGTTPYAAGAPATIGVTLNGGAGSSGNSGSSTSGAGGGGAGNSTGGGNASGTTGGSGGTGSVTGGSGAAGLSSGSADGNDATGLAAGGGGARGSGTNFFSRAGGNGGNGRIIVTWTCPTYSLTGTSGVSPICTAPGTSVITLTGSASGLPVGTYTVTYNRSLPSATGLTATMTVSSAGTGTFTATGLTTSGNSTITVTNLSSGATGGVCSSNISSNNTTVITVNSAPAISGQPASQAICNGNPVTFSVTATGTAPLSYQWRKGGVNISGETNSTFSIPAVSASDAATYTVVITNSCGTTTSNGAVLTIGSAPSISSHPLSLTRCTGTSATFSVTASGTPTPTYQWRKDGINISGATSASYTISSVTLASDGIYDVVVTNTCGNTTSNGATLTVNQSPSVNASNGGAVCVGETIQLNANATGVNFQWSGPSSFTSTLQNPTRSSAVTGFAGTYTVTVTDQNNGCTSSATTSVTVNSLPTAAAGSNSPVCSGNSINLSTTSVSGATYAWSGPDNFTSNLRTPSITNAQNINSGLYTVIVTNTSTGCTNTSSVNVTVNNTPVVTASSNSPACTGASVSLSALPSGGTYSWSGPASYTSTAQNPNRTNATQAMAGTYTVTVTVGGCSATGSTVVAVNQTPSGNATSSAATVCEGTNVTLNANQFLTNSYTASPNASIPDNNTSGVNSTIAVPAQAIASASQLKIGINLTHTYVGDLIAKVTTPCGVITVFDRPGVPASTNGNSQNLSGYYEFDVNASNVLPETNTGVTTIPAGTYAPSNTNGTKNTDWSSLPFPCSAGGNWVLNMSDRASGDVGTLVSWTISILTNDGITYSWTSTPSGFISNSATPLAPVNANTTFNLAATANGCTNTKTVSVNATPAPVAVASSNAPVCDGNDINFLADNLAPGQLTGNTYQWRNPANQVFSTQQNPTISNATVLQNGTYTVVVTNQYLCSATTTIDVEVNPNPTVTVSSQVNVNCFGESNGSLIALASNGTGPYDYTTDFVNFNQNGEFDNLSAGPIAVYVSDFFGCQGLLNATITEPAQLQMNKSFTDQFCPSTFGSISINATGGTSPYQYSFDGGNTFVNNSTNNTLIAGNYSLMVKDQHGCETSLQSQNLQLINTPSTAATAIVSSNGIAFCESNTATTLSQSGGVLGSTAQWKWYSDACGNTLVGSGNSISVSPSASKTYYVRAEDVCGTSQCANLLLTVNTNPSLSITNQQNVSCFGAANGSLSLQASNGSAPFTFTLNSSSTNQTGVFTNLDEGSYTISVVDNNGCNGSLSASITQPTLLQFNKSNTDQLCPSTFGSITINATGGVNPYTYSFDNGATFINNNTNNTLIAGSYNLKVRDANGCETAIQSQDIILVNTPSTPATAVTSQNGTELCSGGSTTLSVVGGTLGSNAVWKWYKNNCGVDLVGTGASISITPNHSHTYLVRAEDVCGFTACADLSLQVTTGSPASAVTVPMTGMPQNACNGTTANLSINPVANTTQYIWDAPAGSYFNGNPANVSPFITNTPNVQITFGNATGSFYNVGVQAANACGSTLRKIQKVRGIVSVPASVAGPTTVCQNTNNITYSTAAIDGASQYQWTITGDATVSGNGNTVTINFGPNWNGGTLCVAAQTTCYTSASKCITISKSAGMPNNLSGSFTACPNTVQNYSVTPLAGAAVYNWTLPSGATGSSNTNSINVNFGSGYNSVGDICVSVTSICGVTSPLKCKTVAPGLPSVPASINGITNGLCNQSVVFTAPAQNGTTYNWTAPTGATISGQGNNAVDILFGSFTTGQLCVTASNNCGTSAPRCIPVKGTPNTPAAITAIPSSWCNNTSGIEFSVNTNNLSGNYNLSWSYPNAPVATYVIGGGNSTNLMLDWGTGSGVVSVTASNACGSATKVFNASVTCRESNPAAQPTVQLYPNPSSGLVNMTFNAEKDKNYLIRVMDFSGRIVLEENILGISGLQNHQLNLNNFAKGVYLVELNGLKNKLVLE